MLENIVYILGAGASYDAGGPLINDFFSRTGHFDKEIYTRRFDNNTKFNVLESIYQDWAKRNANPNIEAFFQTVEYYRITGKKFQEPHKGKVVDSELIERYLIWYIASYIRHSIAAQRNPPHYYRSFAKKLKRRGVRSTVLSFNYDLVIEKQLMNEFNDFNYGLGKIKGTKKFSYQRGIPLYKLHGSLNWMVCDNCDRIYVSEESEAHKYARSSCTKRCGGYLDPYIVPPSPSKGESLGPRNKLWAKAGRKLDQADKIVVIGYSLPPLDFQAKELIKDGAQSTPEIIIVNRNPQTISDISEAIGRPELADLNIPITFKDYVLNKM